VTRAALALLVAVPALAQAEPKKDVMLHEKSPHHGPVLAPGAKPAALINLYNEHTHEWLAIDPKAPPSEPVIDEFLRDHFTNKSMKMDPKLVGILIAAARAFHSDLVDIVSGFRHPKFNLMLRKKGHQVARDSQHSHGNAIDFYIPHIPTPTLHAWAKAQHIGGVGIYLASGFVHMDTGPIRFWSGD
jgi:uncharacterized protein YcbK (DUF882 family)